MAKRLVNFDRKDFRDKWNIPHYDIPPIYIAVSQHEGVSAYRWALKSSPLLFASSNASLDIELETVSSLNSASPKVRIPSRLIAPINFKFVFVLIGISIDVFYGYEFRSTGGAISVDNRIGTSAIGSGIGINWKVQDKAKAAVGLTSVKVKYVYEILTSLLYVTSSVRGEVNAHHVAWQRRYHSWLNPAWLPHGSEEIQKVLEREPPLLEGWSLTWTWDGSPLAPQASRLVGRPTGVRATPIVGSPTGSYLDGSG
ncbi:hypothetical protein F5J12DRAFT_924942 [Pisolithus orientalis]|uniref:uncharacterized protein n=1 Tax=Pisolithus orientalis TaxID=936130 RepID=UPI002224B614|nr:uncharacterized protein F5J12DRAFT_924942 [Pisolithus orientalis]KAI6030562.1 hypothetical protein F5J12DRAFT_924942 [Pisolithus orientalis]